MTGQPAELLAELPPLPLHGHAPLVLRPLGPPTLRPGPRLQLEPVPGVLPARQRHAVPGVVRLAYRGAGDI